MWTAVSAPSPDRPLGGEDCMPLMSLCSASCRWVLMLCSSERYERDIDSSFSTERETEDKGLIQTIQKTNYIWVYMCSTKSACLPVFKDLSSAWQCWRQFSASLSSSRLSVGVKRALSRLSARKSARWASRCSKACCLSDGDWERTYGSRFVGWEKLLEESLQESYTGMRCSLTSRILGLLFIF